MDSKLSKTSKTKKIVLGLFVLLLAVSVCQAVFGDGMTANLDGDEVGGPFGA